MDNMFDSYVDVSEIDSIESADDTLYLYTEEDFADDFEDIDVDNIRMAVLN
jgi:hypothetical protein